MILLIAQRFIMSSNDLLWFSMTLANFYDFYSVQIVPTLIKEKKRKEKEPTDGAQDKKNIYVTSRIKIRSNSEFRRIVQAGNDITDQVVLNSSID